MRGFFENGQPKIEIEVKGTSEHSKKIIALIDSGFNGYLQLPFLEAFPLGLILKGTESSMLADGSLAPHFVCKGQVCLDGKCIVTTIDIQPSSIILIGTGLLKELGKTFILDCKKETVEIKDGT